MTNVVRVEAFEPDINKLATAQIGCGGKSSASRPCTATKCSGRWSISLWVLPTKFRNAAK